MHDDVLAANDAFYAAFRARDAGAMAKIWSREHEVACTHPGWTPMHGRAVILESWSRILSNPQSPRVQCVDAVAHVGGLMAWITCREIIEGAMAAATNIFVREGDAWRMVHHHASPMPGTPSADDLEEWN